LQLHFYNLGRKTANGFFMETKLRYFIVLLALVAGVNHVAAQGTTAFTYQGQLRDGGTNANGAYTMIFRLYDASTNGNQIGVPITNSPTLFNGLFSVNLDFGTAAFNGNARWLGITVTNGPTTETLWPRVQVLPSPYALFAAVAGTVTNGAIGNAQLAANAVGTTNIQNGAVTSAQLAAGAVANSNLAVNAVTTTNIQNGSVTTAQIADGAVVNRNLAANAVNATNIASGQVVKSINGLFTDNVVLSLIGILQPGANTALFPIGTNLQVSALVPNVQVFTTNGTFVVPGNVTRIKVELWGGGGGGGKGSSSWNGGGGGAGGYAFNVFNVTPGANYSVTVGIGGTNGVAGTFSSFGNLVSATGGGAGTNATSNANGGGGNGGTTTNSIVSFGVGGATTNSIVLFAGGAGQAGWAFESGNGASAIGPLGGAGGLGVATSGMASVPGLNASGPGGGGSGSSAGQNPAPGGTGGPGLVIVYY
jgi:hypothetical protein